MSSSTGTVVFNDSRIKATGVIATESIGVGTTNPRSTLDINATDALIVPSGTTDERPSTAVPGMFRYNSTTNYFETYTTSGWASIATPPSIVSFSPNQIATADVTTEVITVTGSFFDAQTSVQLEGADGTLYDITNFTFVDNATIRFTIGTLVSGQLANRPYKIVVTNGAGLTTKSSQTLGFGSPTWSSPASGSTQGFITSGSTTLTLSATDAIGGSSVSYSVVGSLPGGLTLSGNTISGTSTESGGTLSTVTIRATDTLDTSAYTDLTFTIETLVALYGFTSHTFTNAGATGRTGPTLSQLTTAYTPSWTDDTNYLNVTTQGIQEWTVPVTGTYEIEVAGARGGSGSPSYPSHRGGYSRIVSGTVQLNINDVLYIAVGQGGLTLPGNGSGSYVGGGGGGTFVVKNGTPLLVAGGGGGGGTESSTRYGIGNDVRSDNYSTYQDGTAYLNNGQGGGLAGTGYCGGGGGGFYSDGSQLNSSNPDGGSSWANGLAGSQGVLYSSQFRDDGSGGFGGGGGGWVNSEVRPGGGGGYSGGQGGSYEKTRDNTHLGGGAGGNYINTSYVSNGTYGGQHTQLHGYAQITLV